MQFGPAAGVSSPSTTSTRSAWRFPLRVGLGEPGSDDERGGHATIAGIPEDVDGDHTRDAADN